MTQALSVRCGVQTKSGTPCKQSAIQGGTRYRKHGGAAPQVKAGAALRAEVLNWGFTDQTVDPGEVLLKLVTQSAARAQRYADELEKLVEESPSLRAALVADVWVQPEHGDAYKAGEYIRGLARLEAEEGDRCANFATKAIAAGLNERMVRLAERQGDTLVAIVTTALAGVWLPEKVASALKASIARQVRELANS